MSKTMEISMPSIINGTTFEEKLSSIASFLESKNNIIALVGAGISVSCGIPDFRSENGLYNTLNYQELGLACPEDLFDIETFNDDPRPFFKFAQSLYPGSVEPGLSHKFLASLDRQQKLLRVYTQNIDSLERLAGVRSEKIIYAHGSLASATCMKCKGKYPASDIASDVESGQVPLCERSQQKKAKKPKPQSSNEQHSMKLRRSSTKRKSDDSNYEHALLQGLCGGVIKPDVTFFGEKLDDIVGRTLEKDSDKADALIVMGTSLSVAPMSKIVTYLRQEIPRILINRNIPTTYNNNFIFQACLLGNCDNIVEAISSRIKGLDNKAKLITLDENMITGSLVAHNETWLQNHSKECVLLFPGSEMIHSEMTDTHQREIVHCDNCQNVVDGPVFCCKVCFDFDLCLACYPTASITHANGVHEFRADLPSGLNGEMVVE